MSRGRRSRDLLSEADGSVESNEAENEDENEVAAAAQAHGRAIIGSSERRVSVLDGKGGASYAEALAGKQVGAKTMSIGRTALLFLLAMSGVAGAQAAKVGAKQAAPPQGRIGKPRLADDPHTDGWSSEVFTGRVDNTLKKWAAYLSTNVPIDVHELEHFVDPQFSVGRLRPDPLVTAFSDATTIVRRPAAGALDAARPPTRHGAEGFKEAIEEWLAPSAGSASRRVTIKTIHVEPDATPPRTFVRIETFGTFNATGAATDAAPARGIQQVLEWTCRWSLPEGEQPGLLLGIDLERFEEAEGRGPTGPLFADCTIHVIGANGCFERQLVPGSDDWLERMDARMGYDTRGHQGVAVGDVNGDGLDDVYICQAGGLPNRLFLHQPDGTAKDVSAAAGVDWLDPTHAALLLDLDADGDQDLVIGAGFDLLLMANDGAGRFTRRMRLPLPRPSISLAAADVDDDGDLDLYACVFHDENAEPGRLAHPLPLHDANNGGRNHLFRNDTPRGGEWKFSDATAEVGLDENNRRWSWACAFEDYDNDGDQDLYVANDFGRNNLYRNEGGFFHDVAGEAGVEDRSFGMSASWGDWNRDGFMDLYVGDMFSSAGNRVTYQRNFKPDTDTGLLETYRLLARGNSMFQNLGTGKFADVSVETGTTMGRWAWGSFFVDFNNDGWDDVLVCNGYLTNIEPQDL